MDIQNASHSVIGRPGAGYRETHRSLFSDIPEATIGVWAPSGGIVLPVARSLRGNLPGVELAVDRTVDADCWLLVICSGDAQARDFPRHLKRRLGKRLVVIDLPDIHHDWTPALRSSSEEASAPHEQNDAAEKRNIGISLGIRAGWKWILFLDDDMFPTEEGATLDREGLLQALDSIEADPRIGAVGWLACGMEDHSVVGHSRQKFGMFQDVFLGAGALMIRLNEHTPFFPNIYNQDWLFLAAMAEKAQNPNAVFRVAGSIMQAWYNPYDPARAVSEEAGDLIGECRLNLLEDRMNPYVVTADLTYWHEALLLRRIVIKDLIQRSGELLLDVTGKEKQRLGEMRDALEAAYEASRSLTAEDLQQYSWSLRVDQYSWNKHLIALGDVRPSRSATERIMRDLRTGKPPTQMSRPRPASSREINAFGGARIDTSAATRT